MVWGETRVGEGVLVHKLDSAERWTLRESWGLSYGWVIWVIRMNLLTPGCWREGLCGRSGRAANSLSATRLIKLQVWIILMSALPACFTAIEPSRADWFTLEPFRAVPSGQLLQSRHFSGAPSFSFFCTVCFSASKLRLFLDSSLITWFFLSSHSCWCADHVLTAEHSKVLMLFGSQRTWGSKQEGKQMNRKVLHTSVAFC